MRSRLEYREAFVMCSQPKVLTLNPEVTAAPCMMLATVTSSGAGVEAHLWGL